MPPVPDVIAALVLQTRAMSDVFALTNTRVLGRLRVKGQDDPAGWPMPTYAIVYTMVPGPTPGRDGTTPVRYQSVQVDCYGATIENATILWRTLHASFFPDPPGAQGFIRSGCAVFSIQELGSPFHNFNVPENFPRVVASWLVQYAERPVPV